jgi:nucleoside-diphosphate-sugar epimerase
MSPILSFSPSLADDVRTSPCNFVVTGASGWLGRATLDMLRQALGADFAARVTALGSRQTQISFADGQTCPVQALLEWQLPRDQPVIIFHYAFLTKDKVGHISTEEYVARNETISSVVRGWVEAGDVRGVVMPSSGAVYDYLHTKSRDSAALLYGQLKYNDEVAFSTTCEKSSTGLIMPRVFNLSGPYINKFDSYALASFIFQIFSAQPITIHARRPVIRSYYFIGDLVELCLQLLFKQTTAKTECFDVVGDEIVELGELAQRVATVLADKAPGPFQRLPLIEDEVEDRYVGNRDRIEELEMYLNIHPIPLDAQIKATSLYIESSMR